MMAGRVLPRLFVLDDSQDQLNALTAAVVKRTDLYTGEEILKARDVTTGLNLLRGIGRLDAWVIDLKLGSDPREGYEFITHAHREPGITRPRNVIIWSGEIGADEIRAIRAFAEVNVEVVPKAKSPDGLLSKLSQIKRDADKAKTVPGAVYASERDREFVDDVIPLIAENPAPVLITGPSGSGKEDIALELAKAYSARGLIRAVHVINCATVSPDLMMSQLVGHVKGAFTNANQHYLGHIPSASGYVITNKQAADFIESIGAPQFDETVTLGQEPRYRPPGAQPGLLILDEVDFLTRAAQGASLRAIENKPVYPVGYTGPGLLPNIRVIAMTSRVEKLVDPEHFLPDLLSRLRGWPIAIEGLEHPSREATTRGIVASILRGYQRWEPPRGKGTRGGFVEFAMTATEAAVEKILEQFRKDQGGGRGLTWVVKRAAAYANRRDSKEVSEEDVDKAVTFAGFAGRMLDKSLRPGRKLNEVSPTPTPDELEWMKDCTSIIKTDLQAILPDFDRVPVKELVAAIRVAQTTAPQKYLQLKTRVKKLRSEAGKSDIRLAALADALRTPVGTTGDRKKELRSHLSSMGITSKESSEDG